MSSLVSNFLPPYNTPEKRAIITSFLREEWDETTLSWKPVSKNGARPLDMIRKRAKRDGSHFVLLFIGSALLFGKWIHCNAKGVIRPV